LGRLGRAGEKEKKGRKRDNWAGLKGEREKKMHSNRFKFKSDLNSNGRQAIRQYNAA
jgi:hypothetical protein